MTTTIAPNCRAASSGNGDKLVSEKDNRTSSLIKVQNDSLKSGERVELLGKKATNGTGEPTFEVRRMNKDLGMCTPSTAMNR